MQRIYAVLLLLVVINLESCKRPTSVSTYTPQPTSLLDYFQYRPNRLPAISIHRGGGELPGYPENCIESFDYFAQKMPCLIECDIEMSQDSVLLMMHDATLDRTTNLTGRVGQQPWSYIQTGKLKDNFGTQTNFKIPTLKDVLAWGKDKVIFTLDVKKNTPYKKVVQMVEAMKAENYAIIITYDFNQVVEVYKLNPNLLISATIRTEKEYERIHAAGIPDRNLIAFVGTREPSAEFMQFLHNKGISTILGTLGNLDKMAKAKGNDLYNQWFDRGVDVISTDYPLAVYEAAIVPRQSKRSSN